MTVSLAQSNTLIIDDFQGMRTMLREFVRAMGVTKIDTASNGKEAIALLSEKKYDIVICDYNLGMGQNGQQILEEAKLRRYIGYSTIWVMVTAEKTMDMFMGAAEKQTRRLFVEARHCSPAGRATAETDYQEKIAGRHRKCGQLPKLRRCNCIVR